jgi:hypothetical protein
MYVEKGDILPVFYMDLRKPQSVRKMDDGSVKGTGKQSATPASTLSA